MDLFYKNYISNMELCIMPVSGKGTETYARVMLKHFHGSGLCISSERELQEFKNFITLHNHTFILEE
jgi:hypothetical protein